VGIETKDTHMTEFTATLNICFSARDEDEAHEILARLSAAVVSTSYKVDVDVDDLERA
jgi:hypothetical protein